MRLGWIIANVLGHGASLALITLGSWILSFVFIADSLIMTLIFLAVVGLIDGAVVGFAQSVALKRYTAIPWPREWVWATAIGGALAWFAGPIAAYFGVFVLSLLSIPLAASIAGAIVGFAQNRALTGTGQTLNHWVMANGLAGLLAVPTSILVWTLVVNLKGLSVLGGPFGGVIAFCVCILAGAGVYGLVTAWPFSHLVRLQTRREAVLVIEASSSSETAT